MRLKVQFGFVISKTSSSWLLTTLRLCWMSNFWFSVGWPKLTPAIHWQPWFRLVPNSSCFFYSFSVVCSASAAFENSLSCQSFPRCDEGCWPLSWESKRMKREAFHGLCAWITLQGWSCLNSVKSLVPTETWYLHAKILHIRLAFLESTILETFQSQTQQPIFVQ